MTRRARYKDLPPGTVVAVHPIGPHPHDIWIARVRQHHRHENRRLTGTTTVQVIDPCGSADLRPGQNIDVATATLAVAASTLADAAVALVASRAATLFGTDAADTLTEAIGPELRELIGSVARYSTDSAHTTALEWAAVELQNHRHLAEINPQQAKAWWATWNRIAHAIDIRRCPDCDHSGRSCPEPGKPARTCRHPHIQHWAQPGDDPADRSSGYRRHAENLGLIPSRYSNKDSTR
ncbi:hypothetical protein [Nocardia terpenica]|uniref:Uncharacterized protein n=1 Tax=Nocardia terpenica TaxID=455432 RepID=A0A6G9ZFA5_9NOCA|nr:hypothetical protein [Nocardia terpenica]QIS23673.1 hypothetical protein F6W96_40775 [Nocardia terpenica]